MRMRCQLTPIFQLPKGQLENARTTQNCSRTDLEPWSFFYFLFGQIEGGLCRFFFNYIYVYIWRQNELAHRLDST